MFKKQNPSRTFNATPHAIIRQWFMASLILFASSIVAGILIVMLLNGGIVNHLLTPVLQYVSLFTVLWDEKPLGALQFIFTKSVISFAHKDPRNGLNLWTFEFDSYTLMVYVLIALFAGWLLLRYFAIPHKNRRTILLGLVGCTLVLISVSYMTVIEHCSGATWVGFVSLFGMGFDEFELYPAWQWLCAGLGCGAVLWSWFLLKFKTMVSP